MRATALLVLVLLIVMTSACNKNNDTTVGGKTGQASVAVTPAWAVHGGYFYIDAGAKVYIKYNATAFPGSNTNLYDDSATVVKMGNELPQRETTFTGLSNGDYYIYSKGTIDHVPVAGGEHYVITRQKGIGLILPVTPQ